MRAIGRNKENVETALADLFAWTSEFSAVEIFEYANEIERHLYAASELGGI